MRHAFLTDAAFYDTMLKGQTSSPVPLEQVLDKMARYCGYRERCIKEVKDKLKSFDVSAKDRDEIFQYLIDNRFVDERRYAEAFVRGKINQNGWGLNKIKYYLRSKGVEEEVLLRVLAEVDDVSYRRRLEKILRSKIVRADNDFEARRKLAKYAIQKGFESDLVWEVLKEMF